VFQLNTRSKLLFSIAVAAMSVALLVPAAQAKKPAPPYERFAGCPSLAENSEVIACMRSVVKGGHFQMGSKDVPISNPIPLTGGVTFGLEHFFYNSEGGLAPVKQEVPGGVIGLTGLDWLVNFLNAEALKLYAVTELAGTPVLGFTEITLPIKVHLINPVLGNKCYVGTNSNPITLHLTVETTDPPPPNEPISGKVFETSVDPETEIISLKNGVYVDNSFAAPGASGCVLTLLGLIPVNIDGLVNSQAGLPSPAGTNETVQEIDTEFAPVELIYP
jgi:hypothetical protein